MAKAIHFEIETKNPEGLMKFYESALGWKFQTMEGFEGYWLVSAGEQAEEGINGAIMLGQQETVRTINTVSVANIDAALANIEAAGGKVTSPKSEIPGVGIFAYCTDPQGMTFGVLES